MHLRPFDVPFNSEELNVVRGALLYAICASEHSCVFDEHDADQEERQTRIAQNLLVHLALIEY